MRNITDASVKKIFDLDKIRQEIASATDPERAREDWNMALAQLGETAPETITASTPEKK